MDDITEPDLPFLSTSKDAVIFVGAVGCGAAQIVLDKSGVTDVFTTPKGREHWREHQNQFDILKAETTIQATLANPLMVIQGKSPTTLMFVENYDNSKYLTVAVKALPGELWISTVFPYNKVAFHKWGWVKSGLLYQRK